MKGRELLKVAKSLAKGQPSEPSARSSVNRSYYASYGELSAYLRDRQYSSPKSRGSHDAAWNFLRSKISDQDPRRRAERAAIADIGFLLKSRRQKADYQLASRLGKDEVEVALKEANRIISGLDGLDAANPP